MPLADERVEEVLREYGVVLRRAVERLAPGNVGASVDEIEQEARIRLWKALERGTDVANFPSYLCRVAFTATIDAIRDLKARKEDPLEGNRNASGNGLPGQDPVAHGLSPEDRLLERERTARLRSAVAALAEPRRTAVRLHLRGFRPEEVGRMMGWSPSKARNLAYRGLEDLRSELRRRDGNDGTAP